MKKQLLAIVIAAGVSGCATVPQVTQSFPQTCISMGYKPGTEPFLHCLELVSNHAAQIQAVEQQDRAARLQSLDAFHARNYQPMPIMPFQQRPQCAIGSPCWRWRQPGY